MPKPYTSPYQMAINNVARAIRNQHLIGSEEPTVNAFDASEILALAFCKNKVEVLADIIGAEYE
jgi:hypothetical protein